MDDGSTDFCLRFEQEFFECLEWNEVEKECKQDKYKYKRDCYWKEDLFLRFFEIRSLTGGQEREVGECRGSRSLECAINQNRYAAGRDKRERHCLDTMRHVNLDPETVKCVESRQKESIWVSSLVKLGKDDTWATGHKHIWM